MLYAIVAVLAIIVDQLVKYWVAGNIALNTGVKELIPGIVSLVNIHNDGAAFGFLSGGGARIYFILACGVFTVLIILGIATNFISTHIGRWSAVFVAAGGLGNCIDRVISGYVQDMFKVDFMNFAIFNVADIFITVGCIVFILDLLIGGRHEDDYVLYDDEDDDYDDDEDEYDYDEEERRPLFARGKEKMRAAAERTIVEKPKAAKEKNSRKARQSRYEDEYEQYKAARAARQQQAGYTPAPIVRESAPQPKKIDPNDPFAEWEHANARVEQRSGYSTRPAQREPGFDRSTEAAAVQEPRRSYEAPAVQESRRSYEAPSYEPAPAAKPVQPKPSAPAPSSSDDFSLDDILAEFK